VRLYSAAAAAHSDAAAVVTLDRSWRGKPVTDGGGKRKVAARAHENRNTVEARVANFNLRGVSAINRNDLRAADQAFSGPMAHPTMRVR